MDSREKSSVYVVSADGTSHKRLANDASMPTWSPDGRSIGFAMVSTEGSLYSLYTLDPDGTRLMEVAASPIRRIYWTDTVSWSPEGSAVLFGDHVIPVDGSAGWKLPRGERFTAWSPDGSRIASFVYGGTEIYLFTVARDGTEDRVLAEWNSRAGVFFAAGGKPLP